MLGAIADRADDRRLAVQVDHGGGLVPGHVQHDVFHSSMIGAATRLITGDHSGGSAACIAQKQGLNCHFSGLLLDRRRANMPRSEEHTSELQSLMRISYAVFCLKKKKHVKRRTHTTISMTLLQQHNT